MRNKVRLTYLLVVFTIIIQTLIPRDFNLKYIILSAMFILLCCEKRFVLKNLIPLYAAPYIITCVGTYFIHYYDDSLFGIMIFLINLIFVRYLVINGIHTHEEFRKVILLIVNLFVIYSILCIFETFTEINIFDFIFDREIISNFGANSSRFGLLRAHGICTISINNGMLLTMGWGISAYSLLNNNGTKFKLIKYLLIGIATILSLSRTVIIIALGIQLFITIKAGFWKLIKRLLMLLLIFLIGYLFFFNKLLFLFDSAKQLVLSAFAFIIPSFAQYVDISANIGDQGSRLQLWLWVYDAVRSNLLLGMGYDNPFTKQVMWSTGNGYTTKTSIEVHWLSVLYNGGLFALVGFIMYQIGCIYILAKHKVKFITEKISFQSVMIIISCCYFIALFTYTGFEDLMYYYMLMALFESYIKICKFCSNKEVVL